MLERKFLVGEALRLIASFVAGRLEGCIRYLVCNANEKGHTMRKLIALLIAAVPMYLVAKTVLLAIAVGL